MGKTDNIKRAKKLKEAKRNRERAELISLGHGPAGKALMKRHVNEGATLWQSDSGIKYSEPLYQFIATILGEDDEMAILKMKFTLGIFTWNAGILKDKNEEGYLKIKQMAYEIFGDEEDVKKFFDEMVLHKQNEFSEYGDLISDFEIKKIKGYEFDLSVAILPYNDNFNGIMN